MQRGREVFSGAWVAGLAAAGFVLVALVAATPRSPLQPILPDGAQPSGPLSWAARAIALDELRGGALATVTVLALAVALAGFLLALRAAWRGELSLRAVVVLAVAFHIAVLFTPLLVSRDVYSYAMYGRIVGVYHANPYVLTPADFPGDPVAPFVGPRWADVPAVYGPGFTAASGALTAAVRSLAALIVAYRGIAAAASLGSVAIVVWLARRAWPERATFAAALVGLNPVVLFQSVGSGHNDVLVMLAVAAALALVALRLELAATAVLTLGVLVKATAALPLLLLLVALAAGAAPGRRFRVVAAHVATSVGLFAAVALQFWQTRDPTLGMAELSSHEGWLAPSRLFRRGADALGSALGSDAFGSALSLVVRLVFALALLAAVVGIAGAVARRARAGALGPRALGAAWGWALLLLMLLGPVLLPWYVTWVLPLGWLLPTVPRRTLIGVSSALAVSQWAAEPARYPGAYAANILVGHYAITPAVVALLLWLLADLRRRLTRGVPLEDEPRDVSDARSSDHGERRTGDAVEPEPGPIDDDGRERRGGEAERGRERDARDAAAEQSARPSESRGGEVGERGERREGDAARG